MEARRKGQPKRKTRNELRETLKSFAAEGEKDSEGHFTLSSDKAARKLGAFQLPTPESWILVLIQAANRGKATEVKIRQSAAATTVEIRGLPKWEWSQLAPYLASPSVDGTFLSRLAVAFRALGSPQNKHDFEITTPAGTLVRRGEEEWMERPVSFLEQLRGEGTVILFQHLDEQARALGFWERRKEAQRVQLALLIAVKDGALASPVLVTVDGFRINNPLDGGGAVRKERRLLALLRVSGESCPTTRFPIVEDWRSYRAQRGSSNTYQIPEASPTISGPGEECSALAVLWVSLQLQGTERNGAWRLSPQSWKLHWIKDGVLILGQNLKLESPIVMSIFHCADDLATDLTGLRLRQGPETEKRREELNGLVHQQFSELVRTAGEGVKVDGEWRPSLTAVVAGCVFVGGAVTGTLMMMVIGGALGLIAYDQNSTLTEEDAALDAELEKLPKRSRSILS